MTDTVRRLTTLTVLLLLFSMTAVHADTSNKQNAIKWQKFDAQSFKQAKQEKKYILLDLVAVWCHWCHVMDEKTYTDPQVKQLISKYFVPVQADHDLRPDLAERYREWGWPATIIITPDGTELVKRAGYISPENMRTLLQRVVDNPSPESSTLALPKQLSTSPLLSAGTTKTLERNHLSAYDSKLGGLKIAQKFIDADSIDWDLMLAKKGDQAAAGRVKQTLKAATKLIDPAFGGAYQYSTYGDWDHPHYEKIMLTQHKYLRTYAQACTQLKEDSFCKAADQVAEYLLTFLFSKEKGVFYASQDADLKQGQKSTDYFKLNRKDRLALGIPRVDKHHYASHNGRAIDGLVHLYQATKQQRYLDQASRAARWIIKNRRYLDGGFKHSKVDIAGPYLADTLYMGQAFLTLYNATQNAEFLKYAQQSATFIGKKFKNEQGGLVSAVDNGTPTQPLPQLDQNIDAAKFLIRLYQQTKNAAYLSLAEHTMKLLATDKIATSRLTEAGILVVMDEYKAAKGL